MTSTKYVCIKDITIKAQNVRTGEVEKKEFKVGNVYEVSNGHMLPHNFKPLSEDTNYEQEDEVCEDDGEVCEDCGMVHSPENLSEALKKLGELLGIDVPNEKEEAINQAKTNPSNPMTGG